MLKLLSLLILSLSQIKSCTLESTQMTQAMRDSILAKHNELRNKVASGNQSGQPKASNMMEAVWSTELENHAQKWANTCPGGHNPVRKTASFPLTGENMYWKFGGTFDPLPGIQAWYDEVKDFPSSHVENYQFSSVTGHYTQVVWHDSDEIGCAFAQYDKTKYVFVCNYYKFGNLRGAKVYTIGDPCKTCTCSSKFTSLCKAGSTSTNTTTNTTTNNTNNNNNNNNNPSSNPLHPNFKFGIRSILSFGIMLVLIISTI